MAIRKFACYTLITLTGLFCLFSSDPAGAQVYENIYRPLQPEWKLLESPHFRILFREGEERAAWRSAHLLENQYEQVQTLVGGTLSNMPVVLNSENDLSNGYVSTRHFRIEVEVPRMKGKSMNPSDGNWLNTVMPHELVHALHLNEIPTVGVSSLVRLFSPDAARSLHFAAPVGMLEGIAVFHESHHNYRIGGRGNHPYFTQRHKSAFDSSDRWSLGRMLTDPLHTYPFDRHYVGGHEFIHWLQYEYGMETTKNTIRFVSRWPMLGYGSALWYHTGKRPSTLYNQFESNQEQAAEQRISDTSKVMYDNPESLHAERNRRPLWITDETLIFYAVSYNMRPGFYSYNIRNEEVAMVLETRPVEDYAFALHPDRDRLLYARYHRHPYYNNHHRMRVHEVILEQNEDTGKIRSDRKQISNVGRLHAPFYGSDNRLGALQTHHEHNLLVEFSDSGADTLLIPDHGHLVRAEYRPDDSGSLFLLGNRDGLQGLWLLDKGDLSEFNGKSPDIAFESASIYDPVWHPDGDRILFTSDYGGTMNLFEYHTGDQKLLQLTNHMYGVMEGAYSPDGQHLAAVQFHENRYELILLNRGDLDPDHIPRRYWSNPSFSGPSPAASDQSKRVTEEWTVSAYTTGMSWLLPRAVFPTWENETRDIGNRFGLILSSGDVLRRNSYLAKLSTSNNRIWYDLEYQFSGFYPGFRTNIYDQPIQTTNGLWRQQGVGLEIPLSYRFDRDTRITSLTVVPGLDITRQQLITKDGERIGQILNRLSGSLFLSWQHRLQQNIRDVQPNTGWLVFSETEWNFNTDFTGQNLRAVRGGLYRFLSLYLPGNRSLRLGLEGMSQNEPFYDITGFYSRAFDENIFLGVNNAVRFNTRYTIPLWHADRGWTLLPFFADRFYAVLFSDTITPLQGQNTADEFYHDSRTIFGAGLRFQVRVFNIPVDFGIAAAYEPMRDNKSLFTGAF